MEIGDVVRLQADEEQRMTILRLVGDAENRMMKSMDRKYGFQGFEEGDPVCIWFEGSELKSQVFKQAELQIGGESAAASAIIPAEIEEEELDLDLDLDDLDLDLDFGDEEDDDLGLDDLDLDDLGLDEDEDEEDDFNLDLDNEDDLDLDDLDL